MILNTHKDSITRTCGHDDELRPETLHLGQDLPPLLEELGAGLGPGGELSVHDAPVHFLLRLLADVGRRIVPCAGEVVPAVGAAVEHSGVVGEALLGA